MRPVQQLQMGVEKVVGNRCLILLYLMITTPLFHVTRLRRSYDSIASSVIRML